MQGFLNNIRMTCSGEATKLAYEYYAVICEYWGLRHCQID